MSESAICEVDMSDVLEGEKGHESEDHVSVDDGLAEERKSLRIKIRSDVEAFLASGGAIREIAPNIVADPPKKPQSNYGGQPI